MAPNAREQGPLLDLHGHRTDGLDLIVDRFIRRAQEQGHPSVRIMTGKGTGKVQSAVMDYLRRGGYPFRFAPQANGKKNEGILIVSI
jgi:dsDNA-specific endonuclease/ATPase MutS2